MIVQAGIGGTGGGGGGVSSVTGTYPIISSGGSTPDISIEQVTTKTVAEMQELVGSFIAGQQYKITNAYDQGSSNLAVITLTALTSSKLEDFGGGTFKNANMKVAISCQMWYDLTQNKIYRVYDPVQNNDVRKLNGNAIDTFPFDDGDYVNNNIQDCTFVKGEADSFLKGCTIGADANVDMSSDGNYLVQLTDCFIGAGKTTDFSNFLQNYVQTGKVYDGDRSTFDVTPADVAEVNPDGSNTIDMTKFQFAGILIVNSGANDLTTFTNYPTDHGWRLQGEDDSGISLAVTSAVNIKFNNLFSAASASPFTLIETKSTFLEFRTSPNNAAVVLIVNGGNYP